MKKSICILIVLAIGIHLVTAQKKYFCKTAKISFYSKAPLEDIESHNTQVLTAFDAITGQIEFAVLIKGFEFEKAKMQEHFNEEYIESDKYPKALFLGTLKDPGQLTLDKDGVYKVQVIGSLTLHGVTKPQNAEAIFIVKNAIVNATAEFNVAVADYNIKIPALVADKVSKSVKVVVNVPSYQPR
ncbi:MAG: YceI family protein [Chitinophagaceae bacterium]